MSDDTDIETLRRILGACRRVAVVGISANWYRPSYFVAKYLMEHGFTVYPVNPNHGEVLGLRCYPSLSAIGQPVDLVDCFRRAEALPAIADEAIALGARVLWMQLGVIHHEVAERARAAGLQVVMDRCVKIEYARLFGGLGLVGVNTGIVSAKRPRTLPH